MIFHHFCAIMNPRGDDMFEEMLEVARNKLATINEIAVGLPEPQVTVLLTDNDNIYVAVNDVDGSICNELKRNKSTKIAKMLTLWKAGDVDVASFVFRKAILDMDEDNINTCILLCGNGGYVVKTLPETLC